MAKGKEEDSLKKSKDFLMNELVTDIDGMKNSETVETADYVDYMDKYIELHKSKRDNPFLYAGIPSGIHTLDYYLNGGILDTELMVINGATSRGKTIFMICYAESAIAHNKKVLYVAGEENKKEIFDRFTSKVCKIPYSKFRQSMFSDDELGLIKSQMTGYFNGSGSNLYFLYLPDIS